MLIRWMPGWLVRLWPFSIYFRGVITRRIASGLASGLDATPREWFKLKHFEPEFEVKSNAGYPVVHRVK